jgi:hypothetical protein
MKEFEMKKTLILLGLMFIGITVWVSGQQRNNSTPTPFEGTWEWVNGNPLYTFTGNHFEYPILGSNGRINIWGGTFTFDDKTITFKFTEVNDEPIILGKNVGPNFDLTPETQEYEIYDDRLILKPMPSGGGFSGTLYLPLDATTVRGEIDGLPYSRTETNGGTTHYLLTIPYDTARQTLIEKYGRSTGSVFALGNSTP